MADERERASPRPVRLRSRLPAPVAVAVRQLGLPVAEVTRYWSDERLSVRRGLSALGIGLLATLIAGIVLASTSARLESLPGMLLLIPAAIGMRGANFGALASRLSTGIHTGQFEPQLRRTNFFGRQIEAAAILTMTTTASISVLAWMLGRAFGLDTIPLLDLVVISVVGGLLSSVFLLGMTIAMARAASERGWNMDDVGSPSITATGDLVTVPMLLLASLLLVWRPLTVGIGVVGLLGGLAAAVIGWNHPEADVRRVVRESVGVLTIAASVDILAGTVVEARAEAFFERPALLVLVPPFVAACGSLGGMLAARLASKLHLGMLEPRVLPGKVAALDVSLIALFAVAAFTGVGLVTWAAAAIVGLDGPSVTRLLGIALLAGLFAFFILAVVAYSAATSAYRFGLDPDNHGIPVVTAAMDLFGILCLVASIALLEGV